MGPQVAESKIRSENQVKVPGTRISIVSHVSKMAHLCEHGAQPVLRLAPSWTLTAHRTCPGAIKRSGNQARIAMPDVASDVLAAAEYNCDYKKCYATRTDAARENVKSANQVRTDWTFDSMRSVAARREWESVMIEGFTKAFEFQARQCADCVPMFRAHIGGDFWSAQYVGSFRRVLFALKERFPRLRAWCVTRSWHAANGELLRASVASLATAAPDWLTVTASGLAVGVPVSAAQLAAAGMPPNMATNMVVRRSDLARAVAAGYGACHAQSADAVGHACGTCTACWDGNPTGFILH